MRECPKASYGDYYQRETRYQRLAAWATAPNRLATMAIAAIGEKEKQFELAAPILVAKAVEKARSVPARVGPRLPTRIYVA